jgi:flagellin-like protein
MERRVDSKKGLSPVIASVFMMLLVVILAAIIFLWSRGFIEEQVEKFGKPIESYCENIAYEVAVYDNELEIRNVANVDINHFDIKKGISAVVATVLIILITVAAVAIIWGAIIPMITNQLEGGTACLDADRALSVVNKGYTCSEDVAPNYTDVQISRSQEDIDLNSIQILLSEGGNTQTNVTTDLLGPNEEKVYRINNTVADSVSVAAVITLDSGETKICASSPVVQVPAC